MISYQIKIGGNIAEKQCYLDLRFEGDVRKDTEDADYIIHVARRLKNSLQELQLSAPVLQKIDFKQGGDKFLSENQVSEILNALYLAKSELTSLHGLEATDKEPFDRKIMTDDVIMRLDFSSTLRLIDRALQQINSNNNANVFNASVIINENSMKEISNALANAEHDFSFLHGLTAYSRENDRPFTIDMLKTSKIIGEAISLLDATCDNHTVNCS